MIIVILVIIIVVVSSLHISIYKNESMQGSPLYTASLPNNMKLLTIYSTLHISLCNIFMEKENITNYNYIGPFLIFTNFFCNIIIKLQEHYITSLLGQSIFAL